MKSEVWFLTANRACCWIFCSLFLVLSLSPRQPWSLNKVFIHHMCPCINKHNKKTKKETQIWQLWEQIPLSSTGVFCSIRVFFLKQLHINQNWLKYNLYPVLETLMKHCLLVSSWHFFSPFFFFVFFVLLFKHSQVSVPWWVLFNYQPTKAVWHRHDNIYNHIQINLTTSKQEQTA